MHEEENRIYWWRRRPNWQCNNDGSLQVQILARAMVTNIVRGFWKKLLWVQPQEKCKEMWKYIPLLFYVILCDVLCICITVILNNGFHLSYRFLVIKHSLWKCYSPKIQGSLRECHLYSFRFSFKTLNFDKSILQPKKPRKNKGNLGLKYRDRHDKNLNLDIVSFLFMVQGRDL